MPTSCDGSIIATRVWKRFRADPGRALLRDKLDSAAARLGRRDRRPGWRWALRDVDFVANPGDSVGLIGTNGAGKSTLLKVLTRVMYPYAGSVEVHGRVGALIEVRAGIHPELTGRENVFLYGALLGLARTQVAARFEAIVEFAELTDAIDRQVKFYSTGMQMRLGFAVAAFLEPDVLFVDEVLAVGDASFQQRCLERMAQVLAQGTTLVLVSHDMAAIDAMCKRGVWIEDGVVRSDGPVRDVLSAYRQAIEQYAETTAVEGKIRLRRLVGRGLDSATPKSHHPLVLDVDIESQDRFKADMYVGISEGAATPILLISTPLWIENGGTTVECTIPSLPLPRGRYFVWAAVFDWETSREVLPWHPTSSFDVIGTDLEAAPPSIVRLSPIQVEAIWTGTGSAAGGRGRERSHPGLESGAG